MHSGVEAPPIRIRSCTNNDIPAIMRFIDQHWQPGHILSRDEALLRWQFQPGEMEAELFTGPTVMLAVVDGEIGGMLGVTPFNFNVHGDVGRGVWLSQWLCIPALRSYNIGLPMMRQ